MVHKRYRFNSCVQSPDESIDAFVNRLRKAASSCKSGTLTDQLIRDEPLTKEKILKEYIDVFEGLGHIGDASTFVVDTNQSPVQHTPRRIAVALKKEVKAKVEELEKKVIIKKETEPTEWISSMVVVAKPEKNQNLSGSTGSQQSPLETKVTDANVRRNITQSHKCENVYNTRSEGWTLSDWS